MNWLMLAFRNLFRNVRRTIALLCTVGIGAGALFAFDGFIHGVLNEYRESTIHAHYGFGQINTKGYRDTVYENPTQHWIDDYATLKAFLRQMPQVEKVFPRAGFSALLKHNGITVSGFGEGVNGQEEATFFHSLNIEEGEMLIDQPDGILLGRGLANALDVQPGDSVTVIATSMKGTINKATLVVTGIFHTGSKDFDSRIFRVQLEKAQQLVKTNHIETVSLALRDLSEWGIVEKAIQENFPNREAIPFNLLDKVYYQHSVDWLKAQFQVVQYIILGLVLLSIFNTLSTSILERKQEIGNLRANGEGIFHVMRLITTEGVLLAFFGSLLGMGLTYLFLMLFVDHKLEMPAGPGMTKQFLVIFSFEWRMVLYTLTLSSVAAFIASFLAGIRVARMPIAKSLRSY